MRTTLYKSLAASSKLYTVYAENFLKILKFTLLLWFMSACSAMFWFWFSLIVLFGFVFEVAVSIACDLILSAMVGLLLLGLRVNDY